jgi:hypothetical protein
MGATSSPRTGKPRGTRSKAPSSFLRRKPEKGMGRERPRKDVGAVQELEVEVGLRGVTRVAALAHHLPCPHPLPRPHPHASPLEVGEKAVLSALVPDEHVVPQ